MYVAGDPSIVTPLETNEIPIEYTPRPPHKAVNVNIVPTARDAGVPNMAFDVATKSDQSAFDVGCTVTVHKTGTPL